MPSSLLIRLSEYQPGQKDMPYDYMLLDKILLRQTEIGIYGDGVDDIIDRKKDYLAMLSPSSPDEFTASALFMKYEHDSTCMVFSCQKIIDEIKKDYSSIQKHAGSFFIFDSSVKVDIDILRGEYGVLCQRADNLNMEELSGEMLRFHFDVEEEPERGWTEMLDSIRTLPNNALCITDRFLFRGDNHLVQYAGESLHRFDGIDNVCEIIKALLPSKLKNKYQVVIFTCSKNLGKENTLSLQRILDKFKSSLGGLYDRVVIDIIAIEINKEKCSSDKNFYHRLTHDRRVFTHYFRAEATNGICVVRRKGVNGRGDLVSYSQTVSISHLFASGLNNKASLTDASLIKIFCSDFDQFIKQCVVGISKDIKYQFLSSTGETNLLDYIKENKIWLQEYAK